jgi:fumarate reductase subunit D
MNEILITALALLLGFGPVILPIWAAIHELRHSLMTKHQQYGEYWRVT